MLALSACKLMATSSGRPPAATASEAHATTKHRIVSRTKSGWHGAANKAATSGPLSRPSRSAASPGSARR